MLMLGRRLNWSGSRLIGFSLTPVALLAAVTFLPMNVDRAGYPLHGVAALGIAAYVLVQYRFLWWQRDQTFTALPQSHFFSAVMLLVLAAIELRWAQNHFNLGETVAAALWFVLLAAPLLALLSPAARRLWLFSAAPTVYETLLPGLLGALTLVWFLKASVVAVAPPFAAAGVVALDALQLISVGLLYSVMHKVVIARAPHLLGAGRAAVTALGFVCLNVIALRTVHHLADVGYDPQVLWESLAAQVTLSILWVICAAAVMVRGDRTKSRALWLAGAGLLAAVVAKLFLVDLSGSGTTARIVSFIVVGGMMPLVGFLAPLPARPSGVPTSKG